MDSLQEIVEDRKVKLHQKESKLFNKNFEPIIKDTINNRTFKLEKSVPSPNQTKGSQSPNFEQ